MKREQIVIPIVLIILVGLLAGLVGWRMTHFGTKASWAELVRGAPADIVVARDAVAEAELAIKNATAAGFESTLVGNVERQISEVSQLSDDLLSIDQYLIPKSDSLPQSGSSDPLEEILANSVLADGLEGYSVEYPANFSEQLAAFENTRKNLTAATVRLTGLTDNLRMALTEETTTVHKVWQDSRKSLEESLTEAEATLQNASLTVYFPEGEDAAFNALEKQMKNVEDLLKKNLEVPAKLTDANSQAAEFSSAEDSLNKKKTALEKAVEDLLRAFEVTESETEEDPYDYLPGTGTVTDSDPDTTNPGDSTSNNVTPEKESESSTPTPEPTSESEPIDEPPTEVND